MCALYERETWFAILSQYALGKRRQCVHFPDHRGLPGATTFEFACNLVLLTGMLRLVPTGLRSRPLGEQVAQKQRRRSGTAAPQDGASPWSGRSRASDQSFEERRLAVLQKAAEMFWRLGYHETSFDALATELSITKPTVYYYVDSKQKCLAEIARLGQEGALHALRVANSVPGTGLDRLVYVFRRYIESVTTDFGKCINVGRRHLVGTEQRAIMTRIEWAESKFFSLFNEAIGDKSIVVTDTRVVYELVVGSLNWLSDWYHPDGRLSVSEIADAHVASLVKLLKP